MAAISPSVRSVFLALLLSLLAAPAAPEPLRPQFHFSPQHHWMNDPNGLVWFDGEYHLFFQYNPQAEVWGHMSWGHAVSRDLVHWQELPVAIPEDERYMIFSGSVVVDADNTSGFGGGGTPVLVAIYTGAQQPGSGLQNQQLAYSADRGRHWTKYAGNPVLDLGRRDFRDPKVFWYAPAHEWIMAAVLSDQHQVALFASPDLKQWRHLSDFGPAGAVDGAWECPDLFELPVDGDRARTRWVLKVDVFRSQVAGGAGAQYFTGRFDGTAFVPDGGGPGPDAAARAQWIDYGMDFYAAETWGNLPDPGRHVWIAWMSSHFYAQQVPTSAWRGAMSLPREITLQERDGALQLRQEPIRELRTLRSVHRHFGVHELASRPYRPDLARGDGRSVELIAELDAGSAAQFGLRVHVGGGEETVIAYDRASGSLFVDRSRSGQVPAAIFAQRRSAPVDLRDGRLRLHVFVDGSSVEVFADDGLRVLTEQVFPGPASNGIGFFAEGGRARLERLDLWTLKPARSGHAATEPLLAVGGATR